MFRFCAKLCFLLVLSFALFEEGLAKEVPAVPAATITVTCNISESPANCASRNGIPLQNVLSYSLDCVGAIPAVVPAMCTIEPTNLKVACYFYVPPASSVISDRALSNNFNQVCSDGVLNYGNASNPITLTACNA